MFFHDDRRSREDVLNALLHRSRALRKLHNISRQSMFEMARINNARSTMVEINHPRVTVIGGILDTIRIVPILNYLVNLVKRSPREKFPHRTVLFFDTADHTEPHLPFFSLYALPDPNTPFPRNYLFLDETFLYGHEQRSTSYSAFVKELESYAPQRSDWKSSRINKIAFFGRPTHRIRSMFQRTVVNSNCEVCNVTVGWIGTAHIGKHISKGNSYSPLEYARYQSAFMVRGKSASQRDKDLLATGNAIVRLVDLFLEPSQFMHDVLIPYVHYLPLWYRVEEKSTWSRKKGLPRMEHFRSAMNAFTSKEFEEIRYRMAKNNRHVAEYLADGTLMDTFVAELIQEYHNSFDWKVDDAFIADLSEAHRSAENKRAADLLSGKHNVGKRKSVYIHPTQPSS
eukprot:PhF_6_TR40819/c0_g1_i3/m.61749